jgi:hypothetical protein
MLTNWSTISKSIKKLDHIEKVLEDKDYKESALLVKDFRANYPMPEQDNFILETHLKNVKQKEDENVKKTADESEKRKKLKLLIIL